MDGLKTKDAIQEKIISQKSILAGKHLQLVTFSAFKFIYPNATSAAHDYSERTIYDYVMQLLNEIKRT